MKARTILTEKQLLNAARILKRSALRPETIFLNYKTLEQYARLFAPNGLERAAKRLKKKEKKNGRI